MLTRSARAEKGRKGVSRRRPSPRLEGFVRFPKGDIALKGAGTTLKDVKIDVALNGPAVTINEFRLPSSDGGEPSPAARRLEGRMGASSPHWQMTWA